MQGVEFEEDRGYKTFTESRQITASRPSMMVKLLYGLGVTDATVANYILLGIAGLLFGATIFLYASILGDSAPSKQDAQLISAQIKAIKEMSSIN